MNAIQNTPSNIARDLNRFLVRQGGDAIPGLEQLDPQKLQKLQRGMQEFLDTFGGPGSDLSKLVGANALESMREFAQLCSATSAGAPQQGARRVGFCGGGGGSRNVAPPQAPPQPPPVVSPEQPSPRAVSPEQQSVGNLANVFNPLASNFVPDAALTSNVRSSPTNGFNPLAALNQAQGLEAVTGSAAALAASTSANSASGVDPNLEALQGQGGGAGFFEDKVFGLMIKIVADMQKKVEERLKKLQEDAEKAEKGGKKGGKGGFLGGVVKSVVGIAAPVVGTMIGGPVGGMIGKAVGGAITGGGGGIGGGGGGEGGGGGQESRNIEFEKIKFDMQKLSQMQQALSNILNSMDELAKSAIRKIQAN